jgi:hypothetical protein
MQCKCNHGITIDDTHNFINALYDEDRHAKRIESLANATMGVIGSGALAINTIGHGFPHIGARSLPQLEAEQRHASSLWNIMPIRGVYLSAETGAVVEELRFCCHVLARAMTSN